MRWYRVLTLRRHHDERDGVSNHQPHHCLLNRLFGRRFKKTSKLRVTGLCAGNSAVTGEFLAQRSSNAENVSIWWRHHDTSLNLESKIQSFSLSFMNIFCNLSGSFFRPNVLKVLHGRSNYSVVLHMRLEGDLCRYILRSTLSPFAKLHIPLRHPPCGIIDKGLGGHFTDTTY